MKRFRFPWCAGAELAAKAMQLERLAGAHLTIRRAAAVDASAIARLVNLAYRVEAFFVAGERTSVPEIEALLARGAFLVAERDHSPAEGAAARRVLVGSAYVEDRGDHGYIGLVSVDPELQGSGIGRALMAAAEEALLSAGRRRAEILVVDLRAELPPWYRRLGYREVGTRPFPPDAPALRPCHFIVMSKRLRGNEC
jgi:ribosomal protein S18 acetylase RimI-like enzyme